jgi:hypothetical protein
MPVRSPWSVLCDARAASAACCKMWREQLAAHATRKLRLDLLLLHELVLVDMRTTVQMRTTKVATANRTTIIFGELSDGAATTELLLCSADSPAWGLGICDYREKRGVGAHAS